MSNKLKPGKAPPDAPEEAAPRDSIIPLIAPPKPGHEREPQLYIAADKSSCVIDLGAIGVIEVWRNGDNVSINMMVNHDGNGVKVRSLDPATWGTKH